jgi:predicted HicB family RNase H-like nuclease
MKEFKASAYKITVQEREIEGQIFHVGTVAELPDVAVYEDSFQEAYVAITHVITDLKEMADEAGRTFPLPAEVKEEEYSGRVTLRLAKSLHRKVAELADLEGVSLNQFLVSVIAEATGAKMATEVKTPVDTQVVGTAAASAKVKVVLGEITRDWGVYSGYCAQVKGGNWHKAWMDHGIGECSLEKASHEDAFERVPYFIPNKIMMGRA